MKRTESLITRTPGATRFVMVFAIATQLAFGQGNSQGNGPVATPDDLYNYSMLMHVAGMDQIVQKTQAAGHNSKAASGNAKQQTGLNDAQQAILVRYANQFYTANMAMFAARGAALSAKDYAGAAQVEQAFHIASKALIESLKSDLGPGGWGTLMSTVKKNFNPTIVDISHTGKKGGN
jgi:hypothetical protein